MASFRRLKYLLICTHKSLNKRKCIASYRRYTVDERLTSLMVGALSPQLERNIFPLFFDWLVLGAVRHPNLKLHIGGDN